MQNEKENSSEFVKTIKKKARDWEFRHPWPARFFEYILLFLLVVFVVAVIFANFNLFHTDADSARYMLSALVQSQAAIVAIVVSLTLIAVQLTASAYSPRVIRIFMKNPDMWILLLFYGVSIFYGLLVLKMIRAGDLGQITFLNIPLEYHIVSAYVAGAFTFFMLFPYMWNIISLLKSENIIKRLAIEITKDKILNSKEDPIQPIMDIIHGSIMKYDLETTRVGLKTATEQVTKIIGPNDERKISERFCSHLERVGRLAISREDDESTKEVIMILGNFRKLTAEKRLEDATSQATESLETVGKDAVKKGLEGATSQAAKSLGDVGIAATVEGLEDATEETVRTLEKIGKVAAMKKLEVATGGVALALGDVGMAAAEKELKFATWGAAKSLGDIGKIVVEKGLEGVPLLVALSLRNIGEAATEKELIAAIWRAAESLIGVGIAAAGLEDAIEETACSLAELTILSEKIVKVKAMIQDYESKLEEQDRDSFQKFIKLYEQKLEKLRAEK